MCKSPDRPPDKAGLSALFPPSRGDRGYRHRRGNKSRGLPRRKTAENSSSGREARAAHQTCIKRPDSLASLTRNYAVQRQSRFLPSTIFTSPAKIPFYDFPKGGFENL